MYPKVDYKNGQGTVAKYTEAQKETKMHTEYEGKNVLKFTNSAAVECEDIDFNSNSVDIYTPLYGRDYTFNQ